MATEASGRGTSEKLRDIKEAINRKYREDSRTPWVIAYSGGKDSTLLLQLVWETISRIDSSERSRPIHVIGNDTLVESPMVIDHLRNSITEIGEAAIQAAMPIKTSISQPYDDQTFWVNIIGRGYIPPTRNFRWCTDRMKIEPTNLLLRRITAEYGQALLLVGTRRAESSTRRRNMDKYGVSATETNAHNTVEGCQIMAPLADLEDNEVWAILTQRPAPWGGNHRKLITMYRNAGGGECPLVLTKADAPSCGTSSPRFGCWTCTVVKKDRSILGTIKAGDPEEAKLVKMAEFRDYLSAIREDDFKRWPFRRDGVTRIKNGKRVRGPFKIRIREEILGALRQLELETQQLLLTDNEEELIREIWRSDQMKDQRAEALE